MRAYSPRSAECSSSFAFRSAESAAAFVAARPARSACAALVVGEQESNLEEQASDLEERASNLEEQVSTWAALVVALSLASCVSLSAATAAACAAALDACAAESSLRCASRTCTFALSRAPSSQTCQQWRSRHVSPRFPKKSDSDARKFSLPSSVAIDRALWRACSSSFSADLVALFSVAALSLSRSAARACG